MPRIIVTADPPQLPDDAPVLLDESVHSVHLSTGHAASQLVERLAWAISDAEDLEGGGRQAGVEAPRTRGVRAPRRSSAPTRRTRVLIGA